MKSPFRRSWGRHVDALGSSEENRIGNFRGIMGSWPTIVAQSWPSIAPPNRTVHDFRADFYYKTVFFLLVSQLFAIPPPHVLDLIMIQSRRDSSQIVARLDQFLPLNVERMPKNESIKYTSIDKI